MTRSPLPYRLGHALFALSIATIGGCAHYAPDPPLPAAAVLAGPDVAGLTIAAAAIDRPFLTPEVIDLTAPLTLNALAIIAVLENPDLKAQRAKIGVSDAQSFAARLLPDPAAVVGFDKLLSGPDAYNGFIGQIGADLNQLRLRRVTRQAQAAIRTQVRLDLAWVEWQAAGQARLLGVRLVALTAVAELARLSAANATAALDIALRAAGRGDIAGAELDARRQAALDAADKARTAESALITTRGDLVKALGLPPTTPLRVATPPPPPPAPPAATLVAIALDRRLDLAALRAGYQAAEAVTHSAVLQQFPALSLTVLGARDTANNYTLGPQVGFTVPLWNQNRGGIAVATATRAELKAEYAARLFATRADIADAVAIFDTARRQRDALSAALPPLRRYADATVRAAARGDLPGATAAVATQAVRDRDLSLVVLGQAIAEQTIALELLTGSLREGWTR